MVLRIRRVAAPVVGLAVAIAAGAAPAAAASTNPTNITVQAVAAATWQGPTPAGYAYEAVNCDGRLERFWVGDSSGNPQIPGTVWHRYQNRDGRWSGNASLGGWLTTGLNVARNTDCRLEVFGRAAGGDLSHRWQVEPGGVWGNAWYSMGGVLASGPWRSYTSTGNIMIDVLGVDRPTPIWHRRQQTSPTTWTDWISGQPHP